MNLLRRIHTLTSSVVGINRRNLKFVYTRNPRSAFPIADDKLQAKAVMTKIGIPTAPVLATFRSFTELSSLADALSVHNEFVVKPTQGSGGRGILVVTKREGDLVITAGGRVFDADMLRRHVADIIFGVYTIDRPDVAMIEPLLKPHPFFGRLYANALSDVRVLMLDHRPVEAMIRVPTDKSGGRANLHQGGIGLGLDLGTGKITRAWHRKHTIDRHPDTGQALLGETVPFWDQILEYSTRLSRAVPLLYIGVDVVVDAVLGPMILEFNARPGLEIQNVTGIPLRVAIEGERVS